MHTFTDPFYEGTECKCCSPKPVEKVTKAYARGVQGEQERIMKLLEQEQARTKLGFIQYQRIADLIKGENK